MHRPDYQRIRKGKGILGSPDTLKTSQDTLKAIEPSHIRMKNARVM
jgi:hypothetical protein